MTLITYLETRTGRSRNAQIQKWAIAKRSKPLPTRAATCTFAMQHQPGASLVAVAFAGWLNVNVPEKGRLAREHLVDVLGADAHVAGTYAPDDCTSDPRAIE